MILYENVESFYSSNIPQVTHTRRFFSTSGKMFIIPKP